MVWPLMNTNIKSIRNLNDFLCHLIILSNNYHVPVKKTHYLCCDKHLYAYKYTCCLIQTYPFSLLLLRHGQYRLAYFFCQTNIYHNYCQSLLDINYVREFKSASAKYGRSWSGSLPSRRGRG